MQDKITTIQIMTRFAKKLFVHFLAGEQSVSGMTDFAKRPSQATWDSVEADIVAQAIMFMHDCNEDEYKSCLYEREQIKDWVEWYNNLKGDTENV